MGKLIGAPESFKVNVLLKKKKKKLFFLSFFFFFFFFSFTIWGIISASLNGIFDFKI